jgi:hypothetical protein
VTLQDKVTWLRGALLLAMNTVECASIDPKTGDELPWYSNAKKVLKETAKEETYAHRCFPYD